MFSMLEVIFRRDPVATQGFGAGQFQITLIISLGVLCVRAAEPGRFSFPEPGVSWHCVGHILHLGRGCAAAGLSSGGFHKSSYVAAAKAVRRSLKQLSLRQNRRAHCAHGSNRNRWLRRDLELAQQALSGSGLSPPIWGAWSAISR